MADAVLVVGLGNRLRGDDGVGLAVTRRLEGRVEAAGVAVAELEGEGIGLLDAWEGAHGVVLVDCVRSGAAPGTVLRFEATDLPLPGDLRTSSSTHAVGVAETIELARALGRLPRRLVVYGIEGESFDAGAPLSARVAAVVGEAAEGVLQEAHRLAGELS